MSKWPSMELFIAALASSGAVFTRNVEQVVLSTGSVTTPLDVTTIRLRTPGARQALQRMMLPFTIPDGIRVDVFEDRSGMTGRGVSSQNGTIQVEQLGPSSTVLTFLTALEIGGGTTLQMMFANEATSEVIPVPLATAETSASGTNGAVFPAGFTMELGGRFGAVYSGKFVGMTLQFAEPNVTGEVLPTVSAPTADLLGVEIVSSGGAAYLHYGQADGQHFHLPLTAGLPQ